MMMTARFGRLIGMVAAVTVLFLAPAARATDYYSQGHGYWDDSNTWAPPGVPGSGDLAVIQNGNIVTVDSAEAITGVSISNGRLDIGNGGTLTIGGSSPFVSISSGSSATPGFRILNGGSLIVAGSMTFNGSAWFGVLSGGVLEMNTASTTLTMAVSWWMRGALRVSANNVNLVSDIITDDQGVATLEIGPNSGSGTVTYTSDDTISGDVTIKRNPMNASGNAAFDNQGQVISDDGVLVLDSTLYQITDTAGSCSTPRWIASSSGLLQFDKSATGLSGHFSVAGTLAINNCAVQTSGLLKLLTGGNVDLTNDGPDDNVYFNVTGTGGTGSGNHYCSGSNCTSASFPYDSDVSCP